MNSYGIHTQLANNKPKPNKRGQWYLNTNVPEELFVEVKDYCTKNNISQSKLIRTLIINYLADLEARERN
tara:strand:+ start:1107 stop:1316 length:210 start_codon:yes stop_codon:yes gene_type:complete